MKTIDIVKPGSIDAKIGPVGTIKRLLNNRQFLLEKGYDLTLFSLDGLFKEVPKKSNTSDKSSKFIIGSFIKFLNSNAFKNKYLSIISISYKYYNYKKFVKKYLKLRRTPYAVVFHSDIECYYYLKLRKNLNIKTIVFLHNDGVPLKMTTTYYNKIINTRFYKKLFKMHEYVAKNADKIVFICKIGLTNFLSVFPFVEKERTFVMINGIDDLTLQQKELIKLLRNNNDFEYRLCCIGSITVRKGQRIILEALNKIPKSTLSKMHITFIGEGNEVQSLNEFTLINNLSEHVSFLGSVPNSEIYKYIGSSNIFILMSNNEGLPISIIEAMRSELPIISTKISGIPELVADNYNGILIDPDVNELTNVFSKIEVYDWKAMGHNSRQKYLNEFTFNRMLTDYSKMLDEI